MLILGAKGFAKELLEVCHHINKTDQLVFYDDVSVDIGDSLFNYDILKCPSAATHYFKTIDHRFTLGLGNPLLRYQLTQKFTALGGQLVSVIDTRSTISNFGVSIDMGCNILAGSIISSNVSLGKGCIVYYNSIITHDCSLGDYVEVSPNATILGRSSVGDFCQLGSGSTLLPDVALGENVIIGAGSVVTTDIPDNSVAVGVPAKIIKTIDPIQR